MHRVHKTTPSIYQPLQHPPNSPTTYSPGLKFSSNFPFFCREYLGERGGNTNMNLIPIDFLGTI